MPAQHVRRHIVRRHIQTICSIDRNISRIVAHMLDVGHNRLGNDIWLHCTVYTGWKGNSIEIVRTRDCPRYTSRAVHKKHISGIHTAVDESVATGLGESLDKTTNRN